MKYIITGRTASGKSRLMRELEKQGLKGAKSYTTRPKRYENEDSHYFITEDEIDTIENKILETTVDGHIRFTTTDEIKDKDFLNLNPKGIREVLELFPDEVFHLIYVTADKEKRKEKALHRKKDKEQALEDFERRDKDENDEFDKLENDLKDFRNNASAFPRNLCAIQYFGNNYSDDEMTDFAKRVANTNHLWKRLTKITESCLTLDLFKTDDNGNIETYYKKHKNDEDRVTEYINKDFFVNMLFAHEENFVFLMWHWLGHLDSSFEEYLKTIKTPYKQATEQLT